jgi:hypothetical protein
MPAETTNQIRDAISAHQVMPVNATGFRANSLERVFVDFGTVLHELDTPDWKVLVGAPGAGKTMVLRLLRERELLRVADDPETSFLPHAGVLPVYVNIADAVPSMLHVLRRPDEETAFASFQLFLEALGVELVKVVARFKSPTTPFARLLREGRAHVKRAHEVAAEILEIASDADLLWPLLDRFIDEDEATEDKSDSDKGAGIDASVSTNGGKVGGQAGAHKSESHDEADKRSVHTHGEGVPRYPDIKGILEDFLNQVDVPRLDILLDNWTRLDDTGTTAIQPIFGHLLRAALGDSERISVKIATDGYHTRFWDRASQRGMQPERHLYEAQNLNCPIIQDDAELVEFFESLLFQRMATKVDLSEYRDTDKPGVAVRPDFMLNIFEDRSVFELLVKAGEGRPRRFLRLFNEVATMRRASVDPLWSRDDVLNAEERYREKHLREDVDFVSPAVQLLLLAIKPRVSECRLAHAVVGLQEAGALSDLLDELKQKSLITEATNAALPEGTRGTHCAYEIRPTVLEEWERSARYQAELRGQEPREAFSNRALTEQEVTEFALTEADLARWLGRPDRL